ncbi:MAG: HupE/UreJ family protein [Roseobacter sp.]|jgi:hydrogenase/urease accessory protein HupE|nr:HupE/UreJ family protein [Roseobacter sp.]
MSAPAQAHSPVPGIEGFYTGLLHPFSTPSQALLMFGLGLFTAGLAQSTIRLSLGAFLATTSASVIGGIWLEDTDTPLFAVAVLVCALAAVSPRVPLPAAVILLVFAGLLIGLVSIPDPGPVRDRIITWAGAFVGANIGLLYITGGVIFLKDRFHQAWLTIAFRVLAAWLGAIALVMLALSFAQNNTAV